MLAGAVWLISTGPVSLGFLTPYFENALLAGASGYRVEYDDTVLEWAGWERNLDLRAKNVRIVDDSGAVAARAPEISLTLSASALIRGIVAPTYVELLGPQVRVVRTEDGRILLGNTDESGGGQAGALVQALVAALRQPPDPESITGFFTELRITDAVVTLDDRITGIRWLAPDLDAELERHPAGLTGDLDLQLATDGGPVRLSVAAEYAINSGTLTLGAAFDGVDPSQFSGPGPLLAWVGGIHAQVTGTVAAVIDESGEISRVDFDVATGPGTVDWPEIWAAPVAFDQTAGRGAVVDGLRALRFDEFFAETGLSSGQANGLLTFEDAGIGITADASWRNVPVERLDELWPLNLVPPARAWVMENIHTGTVAEGSARLRIGPEGFKGRARTGDEVDLTFAFTDGVATVEPSRPHLTGARGTGHLTATTFDMAVEEGAIGGLEITEGVLHIDGLDTTGPSMVIDLVISGDTADAIEILDRPPVNLEGILVPGAPPLGGVMTARAQITMPVQPVILPSQVKFAAAANVREFSMEDPNGRYNLSQGSLTVRADANSAVISGDVAINGVPLQVELRHGFYQGPEQPNRLSVRGVVTDSDRDALGFSTGSMIRGPVGVSAEIEASAWTLSRAGVALDLSQAVLDLPIQAWRKPAGMAATARFDVVSTSEGAFDVPTFVIEAPTVNASAMFLYDPAAGATGTATINAIPLGFSWAPGPGPGDNDNGESVSRLALTAMLDDAGRAAIGFPTGAWMQGPVSAAAEVESVGGAAQSVVVNLNLTEAALAIAGVPWGKAPGEDGVAQLTLGPDAVGGLQVRSFALSAAGLAASGSVRMDAAGEFQQVSIARLVLDQNNLAATISRGESGALQLAVQGESFDLRPFMDRLFDPLEGVGMTLDVSATFDRVIISDDQVVANVQGVIGLADGRVRSADTLGILASGAPMTVKLSDIGGEQNIVITSADAGEFLSTFDLFQGAQGGNLTLAARVDHDLPGRPMVGMATVDAFRLIQAPAMAQMLSVASLTGLGDLLQGTGISFVGFEAPFTAQGGVVTLGRSRAWGPALGITLEGQFSRRQDLVAIEGTLVPAYTINSVLGAIPLLGDLIIGEGAFALNYQISERITAPVITVNPLSVLAPGFLRGIIFGFGADPDGGAGDPPPEEEVEEEVEEEPPEPPAGN